VEPAEFTALMSSGWSPEWTTVVSSGRSSFLYWNKNKAVILTATGLTSSTYITVEAEQWAASNPCSSKIVLVMTSAVSPFPKPLYGRWRVVGSSRDRTVLDNLMAGPATARWIAAVGRQASISGLSSD